MRTFAMFVAIFMVSACSALWQSMPKLEPPAIGETVELHGYAYGDVNNQGDAEHPLSISNGKVTFAYGDLCELEPVYHDKKTQRDYPVHHFVMVVAFGNGTVLLRYSGDHPDPNTESRNCFDGVLFDVSRDTFDEMRYRHIEFLKKAGEQ
ncbi:MAG: hypothetical protein HYT22_03850 [Candidatus Niyogibacteria bacterium]|nr:hypothetical protein [Candidatus Niyogibacteria bacterium]